MRSLRALVSLSATTFAFALASVASADVPNDPCMDKVAGDACETLEGAAGTCTDNAGVLECVENAGTGGGGAGGSGTGGSGTGGSGTGGDAAGGSGSGGGGDTDDGGCSVRATGATAAGSMSLLALAVLGASRLVRRRRAH